MYFFIVVLFICLFVSLFTIYQLAKDDLVLFRKDISMDKVFNLVFLDFAVGLFFARLFYAIFYSPRFLIDPLSFLLFPYFPGLTLSAGIIGGILFFVLYSRSKKIPLGRLSDFFSVGLLSSLPIGYLGFFILTGGKNIYSGILSLIYLVIGIIFIKYVYQLLPRGILKDGSLALAVLTFIGLLSLIQISLEYFSNLEFIRQPENYLSIIIVLVSVFLFVKQEKVIKFRRR